MKDSDRKQFRYNAVQFCISVCATSTGKDPKVQKEPWTNCRLHTSFASNDGDDDSCCSLLLLQAVGLDADSRNNVEHTSPTSGFRLSTQPQHVGPESVAFSTGHAKVQTCIRGIHAPYE